MLLNQMEGRADSWAIRWNWTVFRSRKLVLIPSRTLVRNIGFGDAATHTRRRIFATAPDGWEADAQNLSASPQGLNVYAECLSFTSGSVAQRRGRSNSATDLSAGSLPDTCGAWSTRRRPPRLAAITMNRQGCASGRDDR